MIELWYGLKHKVIPRTVAYIGKYVLKAILKTCTINNIGAEKYKEAAKKERCIVTLWHNRLVLAAEILHMTAPNHDYAVLISQSRDGEILSAITESYKGGRSIRVPHNAKKEALRKAINHIKYAREILVLTPDGPKGPRFKIKPGTIIAAAESRALTFPMSWSSTKFWQLKTWDRLIIPKPFSRIEIRFGEPLKFTPETNQNDIDIEHHAQELEERLNYVKIDADAAVSKDTALWPV